MQNFNFVVLSVIIAPRNILTFHSSKTYLPTAVSLNVRGLELHWCSKEQSKKKRASQPKEDFCQW